MASDSSNSSTTSADAPQQRRPSLPPGAGPKPRSRQQSTTKKKRTPAQKEHDRKYHAKKRKEMVEAERIRKLREYFEKLENRVMPEQYTFTFTGLPLQDQTHLQSAHASGQISYSSNMQPVSHFSSQASLSIAPSQTALDSDSFDVELPSFPHSGFQRTTLLPLQLTEQLWPQSGNHTQDGSRNLLEHSFLEESSNTTRDYVTDEQGLLDIDLYSLSCQNDYSSLVSQFLADFENA